MSRNVKIVLVTFVLAAILVLCFYGLNQFDIQEETNDDLQSQEFDYYQFKAFDLKKYDINAQILLPDETAGIGTAFLPEMLHEEGGHLWQLQSGRNFILHIEDLGELTGVFQDFKTNLFKSNAFTIKLLMETDSLLVYSRVLSNQYQKETEEVFNIYAVKQIDGRLYQFRNREEGNTKAEILFMQKSIESIK
jgi:hypothetical protein